MSDFGALKMVDLRTIWPHEASDFTPWLADHLSDLGTALGLDLELQQTEVEVGDFSLDILAREVGTGGTVVIENQLNATDHDHLGKLLTYAAGHDARTVIWVAERIRDEHRQALEWMNQRTGEHTGFFAVTVSVFQIDDSKPAFEFIPVVSPNSWQKATSAPKGNTPKEEAYRTFFQQLIDVLRTEHKFTAAKIAQPQSWYTFPSGLSKLVYAASFVKGGKVRTELYIDTGDGSRNKAIFDALTSHREEIEGTFGEKLEWERMETKQASRVAAYRPGSIDLTDDQLEVLRKGMVERLLRLKSAFTPWLAQAVAAT